MNWVSKHKKAKTRVLSRGILRKLVDISITFMNQKTLCNKENLRLIQAEIFVKKLFFTTDFQNLHSVWLAAIQQVRTNGQ